MSVASFDVIFIEKLLIGESWDFLGIFHLYRKKVIFVCELNLGCEMGESVDFSGV